MKTFFGSYTKKRSYRSLWEKICRQKLHKKLFGQVWKIRQNASHPKNLPTLTPMMKRHLRPVAPLLKGQRGIPSPCLHSPAFLCILFYTSYVQPTWLTEPQIVSLSQPRPHTEWYISEDRTLNGLLWSQQTQFCLR